MKIAVGSKVRYRVCGIACTGTVTALYGRKSMVVMIGRTAVPAADVIEVLQ